VPPLKYSANPSSLEKTFKSVILLTRVSKLIIDTNSIKMPTGTQEIRNFLLFFAIVNRDGISSANPTIRPLREPVDKISAIEHKI
jgi:hypothetical protein